MILHEDIDSTELASFIRKGDIAFGGNRRLKIYGRLNCRSGKRMGMRNRVFFGTEAEAIAAGYRPCGHCMKEKYAEWNGK